MQAITKADLTKEDSTFDYQPELTSWLDAYAGEYDDSIVHTVTL